MKQRLPDILRKEAIRSWKRIITAELVFCEVKYRKDEKNGHPLEAVDRRKQRTISRCALYYMTEHGFEDLDCRFDVVGIFGEEITLIRNAFAFSSF